MSYKHIAISEEYYSHIETIKKNLDIKSNGELIESMILYFHVLGFDPRDLKQNSVIQEIGRIKNDISKLRDTTVAFIRQQEKGLLAPLINQVNTNTEQLLKYLANEPLTVKHLEEFKKSIESNDSERLMELMRNANKIREILNGESQDLVRKESTTTKLYTK